MVGRTSKIRAFFPSVKTPANPCPVWLNHQKPFWSYILYYQDKGKPRISPPKITSPTHQILTPDHTKKIKKRFIRALAHFVNQHPRLVFLTRCRQMLNRNPKGTPDLAFDDLRQRRVNRIFLIGFDESFTGCRDVILTTRMCGGTPNTYLVLNFVLDADTTWRCYKTFPVP